MSGDPAAGTLPGAAAGPQPPRYAIYYAPDHGSPWWRFGAHWLGRDERSGTALAQPPAPPLAAAELAGLTAAPRRYGFHATLKAPFRLAPGITADHLLARTRALAARLKPVPLGTLVPVLMDGFVALVPSAQDPSLGVLAQACVRELDDLRAPLSEADRARRRPDALDARGRELLERFGYPHVLERFRFHMTLTDRLPTAQAGDLVALLARQLAQLNAAHPPVLDRLCVFVEQGRHAQAGPQPDFVRWHDCLLAHDAAA